jgi:hypothetical protein
MHRRTGASRIARAGGRWVGRRPGGGPACSRRPLRRGGRSIDTGSIDPMSPCRTTRSAVLPRGPRGTVRFRATARIAGATGPPAGDGRPGPRDEVDRHAVNRPPVSAFPLQNKAGTSRPGRRPRRPGPRRPTPGPAPTSAVLAANNHGHRPTPGPAPRAPTRSSSPARSRPPPPPPPPARARRIGVERGGAGKSAKRLRATDEPWPRARNAELRRSIFPMRGSSPADPGARRVADERDLPSTARGRGPGTRSPLGSGPTDVTTPSVPLTEVSGTAPFSRAGRP